MQACQQLLYCGTLVVLERLSSIYGDNSVSQETLSTILEVVGHVWPLLPMIAISSCSTYVKGVWLQQQLEDSMVFIHRLSEISWDKMFNLFVPTDHTLVEFSPHVIEWQGGIGATITCTSDMLIRIWFCFPMNVGLTLAMPMDTRVYRCRGEHFANVCVIEQDRCGGGSVLVLGEILYSVSLTAYAAVSQRALHKMEDTWDTDTFYSIFSLFL